MHVFKKKQQEQDDAGYDGDEIVKNMQREKTRERFKKNQLKKEKKERQKDSNKKETKKMKFALRF